MRTDVIFAVDDEKNILALYRRIFGRSDPGKFDILGSANERISLPTLDCRTYDDPLKLVADYRSQFAAGLRAAVCILDVLMPQQSGFATARQLREIDPDIEIIVCTADPGTVPFAVSREFGNSVFFVRKPPNSDEFAMLVHSLVRSWRERRKLRRSTAMLRRRAESMRRQTAFFSSLLASVPDLIFMKDVDGIYITCNEMFARFARRKPEEIIGGTDWGFLSPELCKMFAEQDRQVMGMGRPLTYAQRVDHPDGGQCMLETVKSPVFSKSGDCIGLIGIARDISNRSARIASDDPGI
jgi:PAS domain S-box-containing protein